MPTVDQGTTAAAIQRRLRHELRLGGIATRTDGSQVRAIVTDFSIDGCGLIGPFRPGEWIQLTIPKLGKHFAEIRWLDAAR